MVMFHPGSPGCASIYMGAGSTREMPRLPLDGGQTSQLRRDTLSQPEDEPSRWLQRRGRERGEGGERKGAVAGVFRTTKTEWLCTPNDGALSLLSFFFFPFLHTGHSLRGSKLYISNNG